LAESVISLHRPGALALAALPPLSLYVHLPWCLKKCPYCDFNSHERSGGALPERAYLDALVADLEAALPMVWGRRRERPRRSDEFRRRRASRVDTQATRGGQR
jgi:coproporphyrinogen III oxidase-like Fe-S oxidoreductase